MYFERNCKLTHQSPSINQSPVGSRMILWLMRLCVCIVSDKNNWQRIVLTSSQTDIYIHLDMKAIKTSEIRSVASPESNPPGCPPPPPHPICNWHFHFASSLAGGDQCTLTPVLFLVLGRVWTMSGHYTGCTLTVHTEHPVLSTATTTHTTRPLI